ncbi:hypothetical protein [Myxococcus sp. AS-1-15]|uniref:hypothetical protein n=1 Tax=Myxococcus sp. AS-1-15 TaxID=2874600 RepID=UPI001CBD9BAF|nr:hypothetical protein [Myxococcus sp. AS-1-15]MBZ4399273.1 hypothetical protein [Myxococcus sp. AS-1-15]
MALSPISRSAVSPVAPSLSSRAESVSQAARPTPMNAPSAQSLFQKDGFEVGGGLKSAEGLQKLVKVLASQLEVLNELAQVLGGAQGQGGTGVPPLSGAQGQGGTGVPPLGGAQGPGALAGCAETSAAAPSPQVPSIGAEAPSPSGKAAAPSPGQPAEAVGAKQKVSDSQGVKKDGNTLSLHNDGDKPMTIQFTPNAGEKAVDPVTLQPGENRTVKFPEGWSGNFRSTSGDGKNATLGEVKFDGGFGKTYYDVSYIEGHNTAMTMQPASGGRTSGTLENLLSSAPDAVKARGEDGSVYGIKKTTTSEVKDPAVVDFFRKHVGADQGYVIPTDDASTLGSGDSNLVVRLKNLT